jgi:hypothetical protein
MRHLVMCTRNQPSSPAAEIVLEEVPHPLYNQLSRRCIQSAMSTSVQTFRAMHIYKCPPHLSMEAFTIKYEAVMNTVMALP